VTLLAVSFVPGAPLLIPALAGAAAPLDADLRDASLLAVRHLIDSEPAEIVVVAAVATAGEWPGEATWDFAGFGVARAGESTTARLPWQLGIGAWLLDEAEWSGPRRFIGVATTDRDPHEVRLPGTVAVLAIGDGSACRSEKAPGHLDPRAEAFDAAIADCLASGDIERLAETDPALADDLLCAGQPVWRWLAAAMSGQSVAASDLTAEVAPYGVGYFVASWTLT
jgi:hypothetical protein